MSLKPELMHAILSMDAYNRGYDASIELSNGGVGDAEIAKTTLDGITVNLDSIIIRDPVTGERLDDDIGFYALAYDYNGETIISYRGTDYPEEDGKVTVAGQEIYKDIYHGWSLGDGNLMSEQGQIFTNKFSKSLIAEAPSLF
ncbi:MAG: hypothetical protein GW778_01155 [Alphaproteobacteria bacterium]|nr:hypothetical protein [Alphaproteobacteria bacterium]